MFAMGGVCVTEFLTLCIMYTHYDSLCVWEVRLQAVGTYDVSVCVCVCVCVCGYIKHAHLLFNAYTGIVTLLLL